MSIHLTFAATDGVQHHVSGNWPSTHAAIEWAKSTFGAVVAIAKQS